MLIKLLIILFDPNTEKEPVLQQVLSVFFTCFPQSHPNHAQMLCCCAAPLLKRIFFAHAGVETKIDAGSVWSFLSSLFTKENRGFHPHHIEIAEILAQAMLMDAALLSEKQQNQACRVLASLDLDDYQQQQEHQQDLQRHNGGDNLEKRRERLLSKLRMVKEVRNRNIWSPLARHTTTVLYVYNDGRLTIFCHSDYSKHSRPKSGGKSDQGFRGH